MVDLVSYVSFLTTDFRSLRLRLVADAGAALLILLVTTAIPVYKPWGMTHVESINSIKPHRLMSGRLPKNVGSKYSSRIYPTDSHHCNCPFLAVA